MTTLGNSEMFGCHFFGCVGYRRNFLGFYHSMFQCFNF